MTKGPLKNAERYLVVGMYFHDFSIEDIKATLKRGDNSKAVEVYLEQFLDKFEEAQRIKFAEQAKIEGDAAKRDSKLFTSLKGELPQTTVKYDHAAVFGKLAQAGIHGETANELIAKGLRTLEGRATATTNEVYSAAMRQVGARELMVREKGTTVMTEAASSMGQQVRSHQPDYVYVQEPNRKK